MYLAFSSQAWNVRYSHEVPHDKSYYSKCVVGGILSCGITHTAITPLDVIKVNMQYDPKKYTSLIQGARTIIREEGLRSIIKGWEPTAIGYSMQGAGKVRTHKDSLKYTDYQYFLAHTRPL
jgi:solute carrier family 25 phosphate transporter 3